MADLLESVIAEVHTELAVIHGSEVPYTIGKLKRDEHTAPPRIAWVETGGQIETSRMGGTIGTDVARFSVAVWNTDVEQARNLFHNLIRAIRNAAYGPNMTHPIPYEWVEEAHMHTGRVLTAVVGIEVPVSEQTMPKATVQSHGHTTTVGGEVVC